MEEHTAEDIAFDAFFEAALDLIGLDFQMSQTAWYRIPDRLMDKYQNHRSQAKGALIELIDARIDEKLNARFGSDS